ncbi:hypothetical protein CMUS01_14093 [Colletotrichum musicola]|uniref:Uncharacterized protein n=1 Tax=Colletotrichum musicola TaxID=2175873 RepID=A0A8H6MTD0_9PEZI|nr:hypothetical protein CMUS01_14093 [Colletotrichum musicola]
MPALNRLRPAKVVILANPQSSAARQCSEELFSPAIRETMGRASHTDATVAVRPDNSARWRLGIDGGGCMVGPALEWRAWPE